HLSTLRRGAERYRQLEQALADHIDAPIDQLTRRSLQLAIDAKANDGRKVYANRIRAALSAFTAWAAGREYIDRDIGAALPKATKETARTRVLSIEEIRKIWDASHQMGVLWGPIIRLWILTAQRRGEILDLRWSEIDLDQRHILKPGSKTKNGKPHVTHLSPPAIKEFEALLEKNRVQKAARQPGKSAASEFVFTATGYSPPSGVSKAKARLDRILGENVEPWRLHDIRTAFATVMVSVDVPETVADRVLNHSASGSAPSAVARVYNQAELLPQRAAALEKWAEIVTGEGAQVISLRLKK
ncbi:MAG: site-specific integrase, partial [Paracoccaceae bacterium]